MLIVKEILLKRILGDDKLRGMSLDARRRIIDIVNDMPEAVPGIYIVYRKEKQ